MRLDGILVVDKARGPTSSEVVQRVKRLCALERVGHTGTLDPLASGVLPLCLGRATRLSSLLTLADKSYRATLRLGVRTDTGDAEGRSVVERPVPELSPELVEVALSTLRGERLQTPPMYSAVKVRGERLYALARRGEEVARPARPIRIDRFELLELAPTSLTVEIDCTKGTYVRVLGEELGELLGCGAHLEALRRLRSGRFSLADALELEPLSALSPTEREARVRAKVFTMAQAVDHLPSRTLDQRAAAAALHGHSPPPAEAVPQGLVALLTEAGALVAIAHSDGGPTLTLKTVFPP